MLRQTECSQNNRCDACEGECNNDKHCAGELECFKRNANDPYQLIPGCLGTGVATRNYCYDPDLNRFAEVTREKQKEKQYADQTERTNGDSDSGNDETSKNNDNKKRGNRKPVDGFYRRNDNGQTDNKDTRPANARRKRHGNRHDRV